VNRQDRFIAEQLFFDPGDFQMMLQIGLHFLELEPLEMAFADHP